MTWPPPPIDPLIRQQPRRQVVVPDPPPKPHRRKVARIGRISSVALSVAATGGLTWTFAHADTEGNQASAIVTTPPTPAPTTAPSVLANTDPAAADTAPTSAVPSVSSTESTTAPTPAINGTFTGDAIPMKFGPVQVAVTYTDGVITDVTAVDYPNTNRKDRVINARALPVLQTEVLQAQSADVNSVSGATYTSHAYLTSLQAAIDAATGGG